MRNIDQHAAAAAAGVLLYIACHNILCGKQWSIQPHATPDFEQLHACIELTFSAPYHHMLTVVLILAALPLDCALPTAQSAVCY
jgi:hypothetical protein